MNPWLKGFYSLLFEYDFYRRVSEEEKIKQFNRYC